MKSKQLQKRINECIKDNERNIIFLFDSNNLFVDVIKEIDLKNLELIITDLTNIFELYYKIEYNMKDKDFLVYVTKTSKDRKMKHLKSILGYATVIELNKVGLIIDVSDSLIEKYNEFFNDSSFTAKIDAISSKERIDDSNFEIVAMSLVCGFKEQVDVFKILKECIDYNSLIDDLKKYNLIDAFYNCLNLTFDYKLEKDILEVQKYLLMTSFYSNFDNKRDDILTKNFDKYIAKDKINNCLFFVSMFKRTSRFYDARAAEVAKKLNLKDTLINCVADCFFFCDEFEVLDDLIIDSIELSLKNNDVLRDLDKVCLFRKEISLNNKDKYNALYESITKTKYKEKVSDEESELVILDTSDVINSNIFSIRFFKVSDEYEMYFINDKDEIISNYCKMYKYEDDKRCTFALKDVDEKVCFLVICKDSIVESTKKYSLCII